MGGEPFGVPPWLAVGVTELGLVAVTRRVPWRSVPVGTAALAAGLGVLAAGVALQWPGLFRSLGAGGPKGFFSGVLAANALNNLPAILVGLPHVGVVSHVWPLLLGVNFGPLILLTGSLAGLLWQVSARRAGLEIHALEHSRVGIVVGVPAMLAAVVVLRIAG